MTRPLVDESPLDELPGDESLGDESLGGESLGDESLVTHLHRDGMKRSQVQSYRGIKFQIIAKLLRNYKIVCPSKSTYSFQCQSSLNYCNFRQKSCVVANGAIESSKNAKGAELVQPWLAATAARTHFKE